VIFAGGKQIRPARVCDLTADLSARPPLWPEPQYGRILSHILLAFFGILDSPQKS
jgi:hypothetical protein